MGIGFNSGSFCDWGLFQQTIINKKSLHRNDEGFQKKGGDILSHN